MTEVLKCGNCGGKVSASQERCEYCDYQLIRGLRSERDPLMIDAMQFGKFMLARRKGVFRTIKGFLFGE